jgi:hypothetical protein
MKNLHSYTTYFVRVSAPNGCEEHGKQDVEIHKCHPILCLEPVMSVFVGPNTHMSFCILVFLPVGW